MNARRKRAARRRIKKMQRDADGKLVAEKPKAVCGCCGKAYSARDPRMATVCDPCRRTEYGRREVARQSFVKRLASIEATLADGAEVLPDEDSFTPLEGESIIAKWQREG